MLSFIVSRWFNVIRLYLWNINCVLYRYKNIGIKCKEMGIKGNIDIKM